MTQWQRLNTLFLLRGKQRPLDESGQERVIQLLREDRELDAIRMYRNETKVPLNDAVEAVRKMKMAELADCQ